MEQARRHFSHPEMIFGEVTITGYHLLDEYLASLLITLVFGFFFYFVVTSASYFFFFVKYKQRFTPLREQLLEYQEQRAFDIKWSIINILGQTPIVTLIKVSYPYLSKVQYNWNLTYMFPLYFLFHLVYD